MVLQHRVSHRQACKEVGIARSSSNYQRKEKLDHTLIELLQQLVEKHPSIGFWQCYYRIRRMGYIWNHKRIYR
ncbi:IS3 family transposase, partial [Acinetobacter baumannii]